ncbi:hypothetical protein N7454_005949 [Penicillium verhagenii]|nr:hypothetical protein N7454_005949 [Penicillium verhagenii]
MSNQNVGQAPPPPGVTPDFHSRPWLLNANRIAVAVGVTVSTLFLIMRIYTKAYLIRKFWWDDDGYAHSGFGIHVWNITRSLTVEYRKTILAVAVLYLPALAFAKLAVLMLYYRILESVRIWRYVLWSIGVVICAYSVALIFALIFACHPVSAGWHGSVPKACRHRSAIYLATAISNTASDVVLIIIPIMFIWGMHLPLMQKVGILCLFGIGCLLVNPFPSEQETEVEIFASGNDTC